MIQIQTTLGADPEAFLRNSQGAWEPAHWHGLPYKGMPQVVDGAGKLLRDGYSVEFNPGHSTCRYLVNWHFSKLLDYLQGTVIAKGRSLVTQSAIEIDLGTLEDAPDDVSEFGCDGAWNAYTQSITKPEIHGPTHPFRYSGGHMHQAYIFGVDVPWYKKMDSVFLWAKLQDRYPGLISTYITGSEWSRLRRQHYGQAGEFRMQEHSHAEAALEYRTPGSEIWSHPMLTSFMLGLFRYVYEHFETFADHYDPTYENQVRDAINAGVSHNDMLDLIPELPGWYTRKLLREARKFFAPLMHEDTLKNWGPWSGESFRTVGWLEWCAKQGYVHYRDDYRSNDVVITRTTGMNDQWEMAESDAIKKEVA